MRTLTVAALAAALLLTAPLAEAKTTLAKNPHSVGLGIGVTTIGAGSAFAMEIPYEYTFKVGPGELAVHAGFLLAASGYFVGIALPLGVRYKFRLIKQPLYLGPTFDAGPIFSVSGYGKGVTGGFIRFGAVLSYLVHPNVELLLQPVGLGATFGGGFGAFSYTFLVGTAYRF